MKTQKMKKDLQKNYLLLIVGLIVFVIFMFPLYWMVVTALKSQVEIFQIPTPLWPDQITFDPFLKQFE